MTDKQVKRAHGGENSYDTYLIYIDLENGKNAVLKIEDSLVEMNFNSSNLYGRIKIGKKYEFLTYGVRSGVFSMYPNIVNIKEAR